MKAFTLTLAITVVYYVSSSTIYDHLCKNQNGEFLKHPTDCHKFLRCSHGKAYEFQCPANLLWHHELKTCDYAYRTHCENGGKATEKTFSNDQTLKNKFKNTRKKVKKIIGENVISTKKPNVNVTVTENVKWLDKNTTQTLLTTSNVKLTENVKESNKSSDYFKKNHIKFISQLWQPQKLIPNSFNLTYKENENLKNRDVKVLKLKEFSEKNMEEKNFNLTTELNVKTTEQEKDMLTVSTKVYHKITETNFVVNKKEQFFTESSYNDIQSTGISKTNLTTSSTVKITEFEQKPLTLTTDFNNFNVTTKKDYILTDNLLTENSLTENHTTEKAFVKNITNDLPKTSTTVISAVKITELENGEILTTENSSKISTDESEFKINQTTSTTQIPYATITEERNTVNLNLNKSIEYVTVTESNTVNLNSIETTEYLTEENNTVNHNSSESTEYLTENHENLDKGVTGEILVENNGESSKNYATDKIEEEDLKLYQTIESFKANNNNDNITETEETTIQPFPVKLTEKQHSLLKTTAKFTESFNNSILNKKETTKEDTPVIIANDLTIITESSTVINTTLRTITEKEYNLRYTTESFSKNSNSTILELENSLKMQNKLVEDITQYTPAVSESFNNSANSTNTPIGEITKENLNFHNSTTNLKKEIAQTENFQDITKSENLEQEMITESFISFTPLTEVSTIKITEKELNISITTESLIENSTESYTQTLEHTSLGNEVSMDSEVFYESLNTTQLTDISSVEITDKELNLYTTSSVENNNTFILTEDNVKEISESSQTLAEIMESSNSSSIIMNHTNNHLEQIDSATFEEISESATESFNDETTTENFEAEITTENFKAEIIKENFEAETTTESFTDNVHLTDKSSNNLILYKLTGNSNITANEITETTTESFNTETTMESFEIEPTTESFKTETTTVSFETETTTKSIQIEILTESFTENVQLTEMSSNKITENDLILYKTTGNSKITSKEITETTTESFESETTTKTFNAEITTENFEAETTKESFETETTTESIQTEIIKESFKEMSPIKITEDDTNLITTTDRSFETLKSSTLKKENSKNLMEKDINGTSSLIETSAKDIPNTLTTVTESSINFSTLEEKILLNTTESFPEAEEIIKHNFITFKVFPETTIDYPKNSASPFTLTENFNVNITEQVNSNENSTESFTEIQSNSSLSETSPTPKLVETFQVFSETISEIENINEEQNLFISTESSTEISDKLISVEINFIENLPETFKVSTESIAKVSETYNLIENFNSTDSSFNGSNLIEPNLNLSVSSENFKESLSNFFNFNFSKEITEHESNIISTNEINIENLKSTTLEDEGSSEENFSESLAVVTETVNSLVILTDNLDVKNIENTKDSIVATDDLLEFQSSTESFADSTEIVNSPVISTENFETKTTAFPKDSTKVPTEDLPEFQSSTVIVNEIITETFNTISDSISNLGISKEDNFESSEIITETVNIQVIPTENLNVKTTETVEDSQNSLENLPNFQSSTVLDNENNSEIFNDIPESISTTDSSKGYFSLITETVKSPVILTDNFSVKTTETVKDSKSSTENLQEFKSSTVLDNETYNDILDSNLDVSESFEVITETINSPLPLTENFNVKTTESSKVSTEKLQEFQSFTVLDNAKDFKSSTENLQEFQSSVVLDNEITTEIYNDIPNSTLDVFESLAVITETINSPLTLTENLNVKTTESSKISTEKLLEFQSFTVVDNEITTEILNDITNSTSSSLNNLTETTTVNSTDKEIELTYLDEKALEIDFSSSETSTKTYNIEESEKDLENNLTETTTVNSTDKEIELTYLDEKALEIETSTKTYNIVESEKDLENAAAYDVSKLPENITTEDAESLRFKETLTDGITETNLKEVSTFSIKNYDENMPTELPLITTEELSFSNSLKFKELSETKATEMEFEILGNNANKTVSTTINKEPTNFVTESLDHSAFSMDSTFPTFETVTYTNEHFFNSSPTATFAVNITDDVNFVKSLNKSVTESIALELLQNSSISLDLVNSPTISSTNFSIENNVNLTELERNTSVADIDKDITNNSSYSITDTAFENENFSSTQTSAINEFTVINVNLTGKETESLNKEIITENLNDLTDPETNNLSHETTNQFLNETDINSKIYTTISEDLITEINLDSTTQDPRLPFRSSQCQGANNRRQFKALKCFQYYQCFAGWAFLLNCHEGWWFEVEVGQCVLDINKKCDF